MDEFYEDIFNEIRKFGKVEEMHVCENLGEHLMGNVYIKYILEEDAQRAVDNLRGRYYACNASSFTDFAHKYI